MLCLGSAAIQMFTSWMVPTPWAATSAPVSTHERVSYVNYAFSTILDWHFLKPWAKSKYYTPRLLPSCIFDRVKGSCSYQKFYKSIWFYGFLYHYYAGISIFLAGLYDSWVSSQTLPVLSPSLSWIFQNF